MWSLRRVVQVLRPGQTSQAGRGGPDELDRLAYYNTYDTRMYLSRLLQRVSQGEEIVIARADVPVAKLVPYRGERIRRGLLHLHLRGAARPPCS